MGEHTGAVGGQFCLKQTANLASSQWLEVSLLRWDSEKKPCSIGYFANMYWKTSNCNGLESLMEVHGGQLGYSFGGSNMNVLLLTKWIATFEPAMGFH